VVVLETVEAMGVVEEDVGIEDEIFHESGGCCPSATAGAWEEECLFLGGFERCGSVHGGIQSDVGMEVPQ
jgi:uncharacterized protein (DUF779 family)